MQTIHHFFQRHGVEEKDLPKAFIFYKFLGFGVTAGCYALCYRYRPVQMLMQQPMIAGWFGNLRNRFPTLVSRSETFIDRKTTMVANWKAYHNLTTGFGLDPKRATIAIGETFIFDKMTMILTTPLQFWATVHWLRKKPAHPQAPGALKTSCQVLSTGKGVRHHQKWKKNRC